MRRTGFVYTLEAVIAAALFFMFIILVPPNMVSTDREPATGVTARHVLSALEGSGDLARLLGARNLSGIVTEAAPYLPGRSTAAAGLFLNTTGAETSFSTDHTDTFTVDTAAAAREHLRLWFRNASAPNVSVEGEYVLNQTGTLTDSYRTVDIAAATVDGENQLRIEVAAASRIGYSIDIYERNTTGAIPAEDTVSTPLFVAGRNTSFTPAEVTLVTWR